MSANTEFKLYAQAHKAAKRFIPEVPDNTCSLCKCVYKPRAVKRNYMALGSPKSLCPICSIKIAEAISDIWNEGDWSTR